MVNDSYFRFDDDNKIKYTFSRSSQENWVSWRHTAPYSHVITACQTSREVTIYYTKPCFRALICIALCNDQRVLAQRLKEGMFIKSNICHANTTKYRNQMSWVGSLRHSGSGHYSWDCCCLDLFKIGYCVIAPVKCEYLWMGVFFFHFGMVLCVIINNSTQLPWGRFQWDKQNYFSNLELE